MLGGMTLLERRIVGVAMGAAAIKRLLTKYLIEWCILAEAFNQIRGGDEEAPKRNQIRATARYCVDRHLPIVAIIDHPDAIETVAQRGIVERDVVPGTARLALYNVDIGKTDGAEPLDDMVE